MKTVRLLAILLAQTALAACSGGGVKSLDQASFTLSGMLSGLASGTSLVLSDGAGSSLALSKNGAFQFANQVPFGSAYDVTVATQPIGQTCAVSGSASSTAIADSVTNLVVSCAAAQFTIGGAVSGLSAGASVVLEDNGANALTLAGNGDFVFSHSIAYLQSYSVTVSTQPAGETCSVADNTGAGSGVNRNVTDVQVLCSSTAYTIGGTVTGLASGNSLTLDDNGTDALVLNAGGAFTFSAPVASGASYQVAVVTQPSGQTCSVANSSGSGMGLSANIANVTIVCSGVTFAIGGTVTGLASGQSVTLLDNGTDALTVSSNQQFSFPTAIAYGGSYAVTVSGQPLGQTCSVAKAAQSGITGAVSDVTVTCTSGTYSVGGAVSGLASSSSVTLLDNGSDALTVSANSTFTFGAAVAAGGSYDVSVAHDPAGETCTVSNGSGTVAASAITSVFVSCNASGSSGSSSTSYTVGGSVSGLGSGASLIVRNSSDGDTLALSASGAFVFPTAEASGASYSVSVETEPSGVSCTVNGGDGIVAAADVTSILVSCTSSGSGSGSAASSAYTVGGTVSGLPTGAVLVLSNSLDGDTVVVSASGAFLFPTAQANGASYYALVETQPSGLTCAVSNGNGTVGTSDVTSIAVSCVPNATSSAPVYTIGGSASGLPQGASVVLTDGGNGDQVTVTANGSFTFLTSEPSGFAYDVSVQTAPAGETCTVSGSSGNVGLADVTSILVTCSASSASYTVGGSVNWGAGASGTFTVSLGGSNLLAVTAPAATFTFPNALAAGSNYVASITAEPSGGTCYIASGAAGYAISTNVTDISIDCSKTVTTYSMTVTVGGLPSGDEVYLALNGTQSTTAFLNGTATFPTQVVGGEQYTVTVAQVYDITTSSAANGVTCSVNNGQFTVSGNVAETVTCATVSYTIGGAVTGLPGSSTTTPYSATLYENTSGSYVTVDGCTSCSTSSSVPFTFPQSVANGANYDVTVATPPSFGNTTCTVANGTGTISSADVTNVAVTCLPPTWSVGGTVTGLPSGGSVVLTDTASGNSVTVTNSSADTAYPDFTIDSADSTGAAYDVVTTSNPAGYTCSVANAAGTVPVQSNGADISVTNVAVSCTPNPVYVSGAVTWENTQSSAASNVSVSLLLNGQYATMSSASSVPAATGSSGSTVDGTTSSPFAFSQAVTYGSAWAVSVQNVTSGWTCQLANASGSAITASVTNVQVTCTN